MNMPFSTNKKLSEELKAVTLSIQDRLNKSLFLKLWLIRIYRLKAM